MYETVTKNYRLGPALIALAALTAMPILLSLATLMLVGVAKANSTSTTTPGCLLYTSPSPRDRG